MNKVNLWAIGGDDGITPLANAIKHCQIHVAEEIINHMLDQCNSTANNQPKLMDRNKVNHTYNERHAQLKKMLEMKTVNGKNTYDLAVDTNNKYMLGLLQKKSADVKINEAQIYTTELLNVGIEKTNAISTPKKSHDNEPQENFNSDIHAAINKNEQMEGNYLVNNPKDIKHRRRYWTLCALYFYKYSAVYRLHATKLIMKEVAHVKSSSPPSVNSHTSHNNVKSAEKTKVVFSDRREYLLKQSFIAEFPYVRSPEIVAQDIRTYWKLDWSANPAINILLH